MVWESCSGSDASSAVGHAGQRTGCRVSQQCVRREKAKRALLRFLIDKSTSWRHRMFGALGKALREMLLADPDMWPWLRDASRVVFDGVWADVEHEVERTISSALNEQKRDTETQGPSSSNRAVASWLRFRAFVLHHYLPHDTSFFGQLKDPIYLMIMFVMFTPLPGLQFVIFLVLLLMLLFPGPPDEFQIVNFVTMAKSMQCISSGFFALGKAATAYFVCYSWHKDALLECMDNSFPSTSFSFFTLLDYFGASVLVWIACCHWNQKREEELDEEQGGGCGGGGSATVEGGGKYLCCKSEHIGAVRPVSADSASVSAASAGIRTAGEACACGAAARIVAVATRAVKSCFYVFSWAPSTHSDRHVRHGFLRKLLRYDACCCGLSLLMLSVLTAFTCGVGACSEFSHAGSAQFKANVFWCRVTYSILSFPFFTFVIPGLLTILTHSDPTGFNIHGACVTYDVSPLTREDEEEGEAPPRVNFFMRLVPAAWKFISAMDRGRQIRGGNEWSFRIGDFSRGVVSALAGRLFGRDRNLKVRQATSNNDPPSSLWERLLQGGALADHGPSIARAQEQSLFCFRVADVRIVQTLAPWRGTTFYCVEVVPFRSLDGDVGQEPWHRWLRAADFRRLQKSLGHQSLTCGDAPFPKRRMHLHRRNREGGESKRRAFEAWLQQLIREPLTHAENWAEKVSKFLEEQTPSELPNFNVKRRRTVRSCSGICDDIALSGVTSVRLSGWSPQENKCISYCVETCFSSCVDEACTSKSDGRWVVWRRYSEFRKLARDIRVGFRRYDMAHFPEKQVFRRYRSDSLDTRQRALEDWLVSIVRDLNIPADPVLDFLRPSKVPG
eukprot:TRINITY_DN67046_c0_g1_i1.p1 TRINITY_DN67046_c0_g1~~TRINITY_DN67046_c0_g1_i1.p1  ORF type:complete len:842 (+),score=95.33 TRINITY_DN67046_c0_g1_i1:67-2592(+)